MKKKPNDESTFWRRVAGADGSGIEHCWLWQGGLDRYGYGKFVVQWKWHQTHKFAYEAMIHEVPAGLELDHLCRTRACVNPWHLEPVTHRVNVIRQRAATQTPFCPNGHPRDFVNVYVSSSGRKRCRPCNAAATARSKARKRAAS